MKRSAALVLAWFLVGPALAQTAPPKGMPDNAATSNGAVTTQEFKPISAETAAKTVLVAGATGKTGQELVHILLKHGHKVLAMSRSAERISDLGDGVLPAVADVTDPASLPAVFKNIDVVISAVGGRWPIGNNGFKSVDYEGNKNLIDGAKRAGVNRFLLISAGSAGREGFPFSLSIAPYPWKARSEAHLRASGLAYTILAAGGLVDGPSGIGGIKVATRADYIAASVNRANVAEVAVACMENEACLRKTITIINDDAAPPNSWREKLAALPQD